MIAKIPEDQLTMFFLGVFVLITAASLLGELAKRFGMVALVGNIMAGVLLGPSVAGKFFPTFANWLLPSENGQFMNLFSTFGLVLFMFVTGYELGLESIRKYFKQAMWIALGAFALPIMVGFPVAYTFAGVLNDQVGASALITAFFVAVIVSITAIPVLQKIIKDAGLSGHPVAMALKIAAVLCDLGGSLALAGVLAFAGGNGASASPTPVQTAVSFIVLGALLAVGPWIVNKNLSIMHQKKCSQTSNLAFAICYALLNYIIVEAAWGHGVFGALIAGIAVGEADETLMPNHLKEIKETFINSIFGTLYFATIGLRVDFVSSFSIKSFLIIWLLALSTKVIGGYLGARMAGHPVNTSLAIGSGMAASGVMMIVMSMIALQAGAIPQTLATACVATAIVNSILASIAMPRFLAKQAAQDQSLHQLTAAAA